MGTPPKVYQLWFVAARLFEIANGSLTPAAGNTAAAITQDRLPAQTVRLHLYRIAAGARCLSTTLDACSAHEALLQ